MEPKFGHYVRDRLKWYEIHAEQDRLLYQVFQVWVIGASLAIPVLLKSSVDPVAIAGVAASVALAQSVSSLLRWHETWVDYRKAAEQIRTEIALFRGSAGPYQNKPGDARGLFIERVETICGKESISWVSTAAKTGAMAEGQPH